MAEFDKAASSYEAVHNKNISWTGESSDFFVEHKVSELVNFWKEQGLPENGHFLDFGCGIGRTLVPLKKYLPKVQYAGVDPSFDSIKVAKSKGPNFFHYEGKKLPFSDKTFDVVFAACVLHHVQPLDRKEVFKEIYRVLKPGGYFFVFEHNPINPLTQYIVRTCEFDDDAVLLFRSGLKKNLKASGFQFRDARYVLFFPKKIRALFPKAEGLLKSFPLGAQYWLAASRSFDLDD